MLPVRPRISPPAIPEAIKKTAHTRKRSQPQRCNLPCRLPLSADIAIEYISSGGGRQSGYSLTSRRPTVYGYPEKRGGYMSKEEKDEIAPNHVSLLRFKKHMPRSKDITLIILKGHLLVEQEMNDILNDNLTESKALIEAHITFSHRLAIIKSIYGSFNISKFPYSQIKKLNALRNQLVHNIQPKNLEKNIEAFVQEVWYREPKPKYPKMKLENRLAASIAYLCGQICGYREGDKEEKLRLAKG